MCVKIVCMHVRMNYVSFIYLPMYVCAGAAHHRISYGEDLLLHADWHSSADDSVLRERP